MNFMSNPDNNWTFLHVNDSHMGTPRSYRFRPAVNKRWAAIRQQMLDINADLVLHGGDLTRDGDTHEFEYEQARDDLAAFECPVHIIPGNMDVGNKHTDRNGAKKRWDPQGLGWFDPDLNMTAERLELFTQYFGTIQWSVVHRNVRFTGFYAAVAGSGLPQEEDFWRFIEQLPQLTQTEPTKHHVAVMHYWPFIESLNEPAWDLTDLEQYDNWYFSIDPPHRQKLWTILQQSNVEILFCGHVHTGRSMQLVDGIRVYRTQAAGNTSQLAERWEDADTRFGFQCCDVTADGIHVQFVVGNDQCEEFDTFGPLGHPPIEERDYQVATQQPSLTPDP